MGQYSTINRTGTATNRPTTKPKPLSTCREPDMYPCTCCTGLECLERPRYFAGMLLTETELVTEQDYVRAKNRLHNRYLHGWGVVCGLQVVCHECEGYVTVKAGYALDPCGNDIIVCNDQDVNFAQLIRACRDRDTRECDPLAMTGDKGCEDAEEHWCLTLCYEEQEARPVTTLRRDKAACGCGCNGHGKRGGCGCGCHGEAGSKKMATTTQAQSGVGLVTAPCEPTRIFEGYRFGVTLPPPDECEPRDQPGRTPGWTPGVPPGAGTPQTPSQPTYKPNTLMSQLVCCRDVVLKLIAQAPKNLAQLPPQQVYTLCCQYRKLIQKFFADASLTHCDLLDELAAIHCPPPGANPNDNYWQLVQQSIQEMQVLLLKYLFDCICLALLPPCPPDPVEDRIILACITVKGDKIIRICNFGGRRQVLTMPALEYWLAGLPIWQTIVCALRALCCGDLDIFDRLLGGRGITGDTAFNRVPGANFAFGNAGMVEDLMGGFLGQILGADFMNVAAGKSANVYDARPYVGLTLEAVTNRFDTANIKYEVASADDWSDQAVATSAAYAPTAVSLEQPVTLYAKGDLVVGVEPTSAGRRLNADIKDLRDQVDELKQRPRPERTPESSSEPPPTHTARPGTKRRRVKK